MDGVPYTRENLEEAWKPLLVDRFHDILPGSGTRDTRHYAMGRAQESQAAASMARSNALRVLSARVDSESLRQGFVEDSERSFKDAVESGRSLGAGVGFATGTGGESAFSATQTSDRAFLVFNPLPYARSEVVEARLWDVALDEKQLVVTAEGVEPGGQNASVPVQVLDRGRYWGHEYLTIAFPVEVPALGYRVVCVSDRRTELGLASEEGGDTWAGMMGSWRKIQPPDHTLENEFLRVRLDPASGGMASLVDKRTGREWVPEGTVSGVLQYNVEANEGMSAWVIGQFLTREDLLDGGRLVKVHDGPYVQSYRWTRTVSQSKLELDITLRQGSPRVEYSLRVDWREMGHAERGIPHLRVRFPLAVQKPEPRYEIPYGSIQRDLYDGAEVPAQRWADVRATGFLGRDGPGVTLVNSSKYGHSLAGNILSLTLLRASIEPDPLPDLGEHVIEYAIVPHGAEWTVGDGMRAGEEMNVPLVVASCGFQKGDLPSALSFVAVEPVNVRLVALKQGQGPVRGTRGGVVLRLIEVEGQESEAQVALAPELVPEGTTAVEVDTLERPVEDGSARLEGGTLVVRLPAYGIATVLVS